MKTAFVRRRAAHCRSGRQVPVFWAGPGGAAPLRLPPAAP